MFPTLVSTYTIDKGHLRKFLLGINRHCIFPSFIVRFIYSFCLLFGTNVIINVLGEILDWNGLSIVLDFDLFRGLIGHGRNIMCSFAK